MNGMIRKISNCRTWLPQYLLDTIKKCLLTYSESSRPTHIFFCICDHFEPYWNGANRATARKRINCWLDQYPKIAEMFPDTDGMILRYSFFYPEEEYRFDDMKHLAELCHAGYGEVEIHLHHDNDNSENLRKTLLDYKSRLHELHGLLPVDNRSGEITYGFIHGNWALDNSRPDGRWCGVNDEITILLETGCYADFTMPSAPSDTQTRKINSIYRAVDNPIKPKSHDSGKEVVAGKAGQGLLIIQGPLCLDWSRRPFGILPKLENGGLYGNSPPTPSRVSSWISTGVQVKGFEDAVFIKIYTHGAQDDVLKMLFANHGLESLLSTLLQYTHSNSVHFLSARQMANLLFAIEDGASSYLLGMREHRLSLK